MTSKIAPFALLRLAGVPHPPPPAEAAPFRAALNALTEAEAALAEIRIPLADALHDSASGHTPEFHRRVVLPLRRDVHNGRPNRTDLGDLPARVPLLARWLALRARADAALEALDVAWPDALAAERRVLAGLCRAEPLRKASALTGRDLLYGLDRVAAAGSEPDKKARKSEPTALRYALRATTKTSPLSWYTSVAWGHWATEDRPPGEPVASTQVNRVLLERLADAVVARRRTEVPHRLAPALTEREGRLHFRRDVPAQGASRTHNSHEEAVDLPTSDLLRFVVETVRDAGAKGIRPDDLAGEITAHLPAEHTAKVPGFLAKLLDTGLLIPVRPVSPQDPDAVATLAGWLRDHDEPADDLLELGRATTSFATLPATGRAAALTRIEAGWRALGERTGADLGGVAPLAEDVLHPGTARLGPAHGRAALEPLARLTPLLMLFDRQLVVRRNARDRFVARFGEGGTAAPADCAELLSDALIQTLAGPESLQVKELSAHRQRLAARIGPDGEIPDDVLDEAERVLPTWLRARPVSYSFFFQPLPGGGAVVNHIYGGFGRFASRFLDRIPAARAELAAYLRGALGGFTQYRPVNGFTANVHPLLGDVDLGDDPRWADRAPEDLVVTHDTATDELRLRDTRTGRSLDVLYLGFLMPLILPDRVAVLHNDLACGWPDLDLLRPSTTDGGVQVRGRLRYRNVVLARRSWTFDASATKELRADFGVDLARAAARLRARHGLPAQVFAGSGLSVGSLAAFHRRTAAPKPQYADLGNALHLRHLPRLLARHPDGLELTEALPVPAGRVTELIAETYRRGA